MQVVYHITRDPSITPSYLEFHDSSVGSGIIPVAQKTDKRKDSTVNNSTIAWKTRAQLDDFMVKMFHGFSKPPTASPIDFPCDF